VSSELPGLLIWGASGHAEVVADAVRCSTGYRLVGFLDDVTPGKSEFCGVRVFDNRDVLRHANQFGFSHVVVGFGACAPRASAADVVKDHGLELATIIHPRAVIAQSAIIGMGSVVMAGAVINPSVVVGQNVIVNTAASIDHHCRIGDGAHIAPGAHLAGNVEVGGRAWVGLGAAVLERRRIGEDAVVGAGSVVTSDVPAGVVAYGNPARVVRAREGIGTA
jgi:UDP-N-acetylbacillosamine N-acetyltransferase